MVIKISKNNKKFIPFKEKRYKVVKKFLIGLSQRMGDKKRLLNLNKKY